MKKRKIKTFADYFPEGPKKPRLYTNFEYETGPSRAFTPKDNTQLMTIVAIVMVVVVFIIVFEFSGTADKFMNYAGQLISSII